MALTRRRLRHADMLFELISRRHLHKSVCADPSVRVLVGRAACAARLDRQADAVGMLTGEGSAFCSEGVPAAPSASRNAQVLATESQRPRRHFAVLRHAAQRQGRLGRGGMTMVSA
jgi:hypothetical protein